MPSLSPLWPKLGLVWICSDCVECFASAHTLFQHTSGRQIKPVNTVEYYLKVSILILV